MPADEPATSRHYLRTRQPRINWLTEKGCGYRQSAAEVFAKLPATVYQRPTNSDRSHPCGRLPAAHCLAREPCG